MSDAQRFDGLERLRAALNRYGRHSDNCLSRELEAMECDCGWDAINAELLAALGGTDE